MPLFINVSLYIDFYKPGTSFSCRFTIINLLLVKVKNGLGYIEKSGFVQINWGMFWLDYLIDDFYMLLQVRSKLSTFGGFGGPTDVTCGGNALKFYASVRLNIKRIAFVKKAEEVWKICSFLCFFAFSCAVWLARSNASVN